MDSVLVIVGALEKLTVTPEVLEATRIGRAINLVRKKTTNEELSKRLKRIVKKWQALLVSLNSKKNSKSDSPSNFIPSSGNINGTISKTELLERPKSRNGNDRPSSCTPDQQKKAKKRKLNTAENSSLIYVCTLGFRIIVPPPPPIVNFLKFFYPGNFYSNPPFY